MDKSLATLLHALQRPLGNEDAIRLIGSATTLLTLLTHPLNITTLSSQLLTAPALWDNQDTLQIPVRILSAFKAAALHILRDEQERSVSNNSSGKERYESPTRLQCTRALVRGANGKSARWKHLLLLGGLLLGLEGRSYCGLPRGMQLNLEASFIDTVNHVASEAQLSDGIAASTLCLVLGHVFNHLEKTNRSRLRSNLLLPLLTKYVFFSGLGLQSGYFLGLADNDICQIPGTTIFSWSSSSSSFLRLQSIAQGPVVSALGSISGTIACCADLVTDHSLLMHLAEELAGFSRSLAVQWRQNKLSELDLIEESEYLDRDTQSLVLPLLWQTLRSILFAILVIQQALLGRLLHDQRIPLHFHGIIARDALLALHELCFISSRFGNFALSQYTFVHILSIDVLSRSPKQAEALLANLCPPHNTKIPEHPQDRNSDLFYFNTAEHFTMVLNPSKCKLLMLQPSQRYLVVGGDSRLANLFEAAHSLVLSAFSSPNNYAITQEELPQYLAILLSSFPGTLSSRQFRLAIKTLIKVASPPNPLSARQPFLASTIIEIVHQRLQEASETQTLPADNTRSSTDEIFLSEKAVMLLAIIDSLPALAQEALEGNLSIISSSLPAIRPFSLQQSCSRRFWEVLSDGEMDVPRAELCVAWWNSLGGKEKTVCKSTTLNEPQPNSDVVPSLSSRL